MNDQNEMDARTRALLAETFPPTWDETRRRMAVVRRYLRETDRTAATADRYAKEIGIGRSLFYRLASVYQSTRDVRSTADGKRKKDPSWQITADAIAITGSSAHLAQIFRTVVELSRARGVAPPSRSKVRAHSVPMLAGASIAARMALSSDFAIDRAILRMSTVGGDGRVKVAELSCIVDLNKGTIIRHILSAGPPRSDEIVGLARDPAVKSTRIAISESDKVISADPVRAAVVDNSCSIVPGRWKAGTAVRAVVGLRLGRVPLLSKMPATAELLEPVSSDTATQVIGELLRPYYDRA
jgi:hypothetical protein